MKDKYQYIAISIVFVFLSLMFFINIKLNRENRNLIAKTTLVEKRAEMNASIMNFYIKASATSHNLEELFHEETELIDEEAEKRFLKNILLEKDRFFVLFSSFVCPTCYNISAFKKMSMDERIPEMVFITSIENFSELRVVVREFDLNVRILVYTNDNDIYLQTDNAIMFEWNAESKRIQYMTSIPKQVNGEILDFYTSLISS
ncbi:MAG: hypothetical protein WC951_11230 [Bacteroidales bacterium]